jgi:hypothetical protein
MLCRLCNDPECSGGEAIQGPRQSITRVGLDSWHGWLRGRYFSLRVEVGGRKTPDNNTQTLHYSSHLIPSQGKAALGERLIDGEGHIAWVMPFTRGRIGLEL